jgi:leader peptidase (prepilin peptidase)/N-methyltransferase
MLAVPILGLVMGTFIGSFLNVCIHRLPRNESIVRPPSRCYSCGTQVRWYDNLPILSWLLLRGRCRWCGAPFSARYLGIEALVGVLTAGVLWLAFSDGAPDPSHPLPWAWSWSAPWLYVLAPSSEVLPHALAAGAALTLVWYLVVCTFTDLEYMIIPDELTKGFQALSPFLGALCAHNLAIGWTLVDSTHAAGRFLIWLLAIVIGGQGLLAASLPLAKRVYTRFVPEDQRWEDKDHRGFALGVGWFIATLALPTATSAILVLHARGGGPELALAVGLAQAVLGGLAGWCALYVVGLLGTMLFKRNAMGFGDVKFLAPIGCFVGPVGVLYVFMAAVAVGSLVGIPMRLLRAKREIPFGPYLALGALVVLAWGPELHAWARRVVTGA